MSIVVTYVMSQPDHLPYLVTSLRSLRRHYDGDVIVHAWKESFPFVKKIAEDVSLGVVPRLFDPEYKGKNAQFECKQHVVKSLIDYDQVMYIDADTMVVGSLYPLFEIARRYSFLATQFNLWKTSGRIVQGRIKRLQQFSDIDQRAINRVLEEEWPSVNGGVFVCQPNSPVLAKWIKWTQIARKIFISDETCLHALMGLFGLSLNGMGVATGGAYNCSPKYQPKTLKDEDVRIWHFHGDCNVRPMKSLRAVKMWWSEYLQCRKIHNNTGGVLEWRKDIKHKHLDKLEPVLLAAGDDWEQVAEELSKEKS